MLMVYQLVFASAGKLLGKQSRSKAGWCDCLSRCVPSCSVQPCCRHRIQHNGRGGHVKGLRSSGHHQNVDRDRNSRQTSQTGRQLNRARHHHDSDSTGCSHQRPSVGVFYRRFDAGWRQATQIGSQSSKVPSRPSGTYTFAGSHRGPAGRRQRSAGAVLRGGRRPDVRRLRELRAVGRHPLHHLLRGGQLRRRPNQDELCRHWQPGGTQHRILDYDCGHFAGRTEHGYNYCDCSGSATSVCDNRHRCATVDTLLLLQGPTWTFAQSASSWLNAQYIVAQVLHRYTTLAILS